jgi:hypothetical protein
MSFLYGFKAARRAARAADKAPRPTLPLALGVGRANAGRLARKAGDAVEPRSAKKFQGRDVI